MPLQLWGRVSECWSLAFWLVSKAEASAGGALGFALEPRAYRLGFQLRGWSLTFVLLCVVTV